MSIELSKEMKEKMKGNCLLITEAEFLKAQKEVVSEMPKIQSITWCMYLALYQTMLQMKLFGKKEIEEKKHDCKE